MIAVEEHIGLAVTIAAGFCRPWLEIGYLCGADRDDAVQEACLALVRAARGFDPSRNRKWSSYAGAAIRNQLRLWFHRMPLIEPPDAERVAVPLRIRPLAEAGPQPGRELDPAEAVFRKELRAALDRLPPAQRELLIRRFGLDGGRPASLTDIARETGLTKQAISKRQEKALKRLGEMIGG